MKPSWHNRQAGASLIEVLVCMLLLAIGMIAGLGTTRAGQIGLEAGSRMTAATGLAQAKMEEKISTVYADLVHGELEGREELDGIIRTWEILPDSPVAHLATLRVAVQWPDPGGRFHRLEFVTLRSEGVVP